MQTYSEQMLLERIVRLEKEIEHLKYDVERSRSALSDLVNALLEEREEK